MSRLLRSILFRVRRGIIQGFFGGGKTYGTIKHIKPEVRRNRYNILFIYAAPLRRLRDFVAEKWLLEFVDTDKMMVFRAHDEVCDDLRERLEAIAGETDGGQPNTAYYHALAQHLQSGVDCRYREHVRNVKEFIQFYDGSRILVTTHELAFPAMMMAHMARVTYVALFDEAEDYLEKVSNPLPRHEIEVFRDIDMEVYRRLRLIYTEIEGLYWLKITSLEAMFNNVIITATLPRTLHEYLLATKKELPRYTVYTARSQDRVFLLDRIIPALKTTDAKYIVPLTKLVEYGIDTYGAVGIIAKSKSHERLLVTHLCSLGYKVSSEITHEMPDPDAEVYILTPGGKWYRGVSIYSKKTGRDIPFIIAFYQGGKTSVMHPMLQRLMSMIVSNHVVSSDIDIYTRYALEMNYAKNLQAIYRYNRMRDRRHIMILLDSRWVYAYRYYHRRKWEEMERRSFYDIDDLVRAVAGE